MIQAKALLQMMGTPKDHVTDTFSQFIEQIKQDIKFTCTDIFVGETTAVEESELFSTFAEVSFTAKTEQHLFDFCFTYMPASIEIQEPEIFKLQAPHISGLLTDMLGRIHQADMVAKEANALHTTLSHNLRIMIQNAIVLACKNKPQTIESIQKMVGVSTQIQPFIDDLLKAQRITQEGDMFSSVVQK
jgi:hypothetical protein